MSTDAGVACSLLLSAKARKELDFNTMDKLLEVVRAEEEITASIAADIRASQRKIRKLARLGLKLPPDPVERHGNPAIDKAVIEQIRKEHAEGATQCSLAAKYGISTTSVNNWIKGRKNGKISVGKSNS
jgi:protoheme ferro-lyase